jgi:hypothetical protein
LLKERRLDQETREFAEDLLRSLKQMKSGEWARKTVFEVDGDKVRLVSQESFPQKDTVSE